MEKFVFDPNIKYKCVMCGGCCSNVWEIQVEENSVNRIKQLPLMEISKTFESFDPFYSRQTVEGDTNYYLSHIKNKCCFLNDKNLCDIQTHFDYDIKPTICKTFPFRFSKLGDTYYVGNSFACPSVLNQVGDTLEAQQDEVLKTFQLMFYDIKERSEVALSETISLTPAQYLEVEGFLKNILSLEFEPFSRRLIAGAVALDMLDAFIKTATTQADTPIDECIKVFIDSNVSSNYERIFKIAQKNISSKVVKRLFLGMILSFRNTLTKRRSFYKTYFLLLFKHFVHFLPFGRVRLRPNERTIPYAKIHRIKMPENDVQINELLQRYFNHLLLRKDLLVHKDVNSGFKIFIIFFALIEWYAQGLCVLKNRTEVTSEEVEEAICYVEKYYVFHSDFFQIMRTFPIVRDTIENLLQRKNLPYILAR